LGISPGSGNHTIAFDLEQCKLHKVGHTSRRPKKFQELWLRLFFLYHYCDIVKPCRLKSRLIGLTPGASMSRF